MFEDEERKLIAELDAFENGWLPRARAIIERRVPEQHVARFVQPLFSEPSQQPLGPLVIDSTATLLDRVEALASSKEPGADRAHLAVWSSHWAV